MVLNMSLIKIVGLLRIVVHTRWKLVVSDLCSRDSATMCSVSKDWRSNEEHKVSQLLQREYL